MGQYHTIYNKTKKESVRIGGAKLWEQAHGGTATALLLLLSNSNGRGGGDFMIYGSLPFDLNKPNASRLTPGEIRRQAKIDEVSGRWAGDEIVVQGDYAQKGDRSYLSKAHFDKTNYRDISDLVAEAILAFDEDAESEAAKIIIREASYGFGDFESLANHPKVKKARLAQEKERNGLLGTEKKSKKRGGK